MNTAAERPPLALENLNATGKRRVQEGVRCFVMPESRDGFVGFVAVCIDFGLSYRGVTYDDARNGLHEAIADLVDVTHQKGLLVEILNRPDNRAAKAQFDSVMLAYRLVKFMMHFWNSVSRVCGPTEYRERAATAEYAFA